MLKGKKIFFEDLTAQTDDEQTICRSLDHHLPKCKPAGPARPKSILTFSIVDRRRSQATWFDVMPRRAHSVHFSYLSGRG